MEKVIESIYNIQEANNKAMAELKRVYDNATEEEKQIILKYTKEINNLNIDKVINICLELQSEIKYRG